MSERNTNEPRVMTEGGARTPRGQLGWARRHQVKLIVSLLVGAGFVWLLHAGALPLVPEASAFDRVRWWTVPAYVLLWIVVHVVRAARWHWLLAPVKRVPLRTLIPVAFIGFAAIMLLPFRSGEVVRPVLLYRRTGVSGWATMGTVAAERVIDGLFLSVLLFVALQVASPLDPLPRRIGQLPVPVAIVPAAAYFALGLFAVAFIILGLAYWRRCWVQSAARAVVGLFSTALAEWLTQRIGSMAQGLGFMPRPRLLVPFMLATAAYWLLNAMATWVLAYGCGLATITYAQSCVNVGLIALGILVPNAPGLFGAFQISSYAGFAMYFPTAEVVSAGAAFVFIIYLAQLMITCFAALGSASVLRTSVLESLTPDTPAEPTERQIDNLSQDSPRW